MDNEIIRSAKEIVIKRERQDEEEKQQDKIDRLEKMMAQILEKLDNVGIGTKNQHQ